MALEDIRHLVAELAQVAGSHGMHMKICSQRDFLIPGITQEARCVDAERLEKVSGKPLTSSIKLKGNREECGCYPQGTLGNMIPARMAVCIAMPCSIETWRWNAIRRMIHKRIFVSPQRLPY